MSLIPYISELLFIHDCVIVPNFGAFISNKISAAIHPVSHSFTPPRKEILFNSSLTTNDGILAHYISSHEKISYEQAVQKIKSQVDEWKSRLQHKEKIIVSQVGYIFYDETGNYAFSPDMENKFLTSSYGLSTFSSPAIQRSGIEERIQKSFAENNRRKEVRTKPMRLSKRAILVSVPAAAVLVWGVFNFSPVQDEAGNYTDIISIFTQNNQSNLKDAGQKPANTSDASFISDSNWFQTGGFSLTAESTVEKIYYPVFNSTNSEIQSATTDTVVEMTTPIINECRFYIIGSCNREKSNADAYKGRLIANGYDQANILLPKDGGLYKVYIDCFDDESQALQALHEIHQKENKDAWLLKM